jgi:lipid A 4'-phosphatase
MLGASLGRVSIASNHRLGIVSAPVVCSDFGIGVSVARISLTCLLVFGTTTGVIFAADPALDLRVASFFHALNMQPDIRQYDHAIELLRRIGPVLIAAAIAPAAITLAMKIFWPRRATPISARPALLLVLSLALGPGLLVNLTLKEHWSRPRPGMVTEFGGDYIFKPWWDPRGTCDTNCSFVSGETSSAVWMTAPALMLPAPWRYVGLAAAAFYAATFAFIRLLAGGHFLSDVIFAGVFTGLIMWVVHGLLFRWGVARPSERRIDAVLETFGRAIRRLFAGMTQLGVARSEKPAALKSQPRSLNPN